MSVNHKFKKVFSKDNFYTLLALIVVFVMGFYILTSKPTTLNISKNSEGSPAEITRILSLHTTKEQSVELEKLLDRVGAIETQELMQRSGLPFTGETHLLIHTIGEFVYKQFGKEGLPYCREYFLSACYHSFIISVLADFGMEGMTDVMKTCEKSGKSVFSQCAHGSGHGFVAWQDYDLVKAAEMCDELGSQVENFGYPNCYDGVFMENIWGVHDGKPSEKRWIKEDEIYYPCTDPRIPSKYLNGCWANQATLMYQHFKGDLKKTALACDGAPTPEYVNTCYNNFARQIHPLTEGKKEKAISLCMNATGVDRQNTCILTNMSASWSVGDRQMPFDLCESLPDPVKGDCFDRLIGMINFDYGNKPDEKTRYCNKISSVVHKDRCLYVDINNQD